MIQPSLSLVIIRKGVGTYGAERGIANWRPELYWEKSTKLIRKYLAKLMISNSRPRSIYGQHFLCPAFFSPDFLIVSRAAALEGQYPVEYRGYFVHPSVRPSICPSVRSFVLRLIVSAGMGALAWWPLALGLRLCPGGLPTRFKPWLGGPSMEGCRIKGPGGPSPPWRPWPGSLGLGALVLGLWLGGPGLGVLAWGLYPSLEAMAWGLWPGVPDLGSLA